MCIPDALRIRRAGFQPSLPEQGSSIPCAVPGGAEGDPAAPGGSRDGACCACRGQGGFPAGLELPLEVDGEGEPASTNFPLGSGLIQCSQTSAPTGMLRARSFPMETPPICFLLLPLGSCSIPGARAQTRGSPPPLPALRNAGAEPGAVPVPFLLAPGLQRRARERCSAADSLPASSLRGSRLPASWIRSDRPLRKWRSRGGRDPRSRRLFRPCGRSERTLPARTPRAFPAKGGP